MPAHTDPAHAMRQQRMVELVQRMAPAEGYTQSLLDDVTFMRSDRTLPTTQALYEPCIVIVVQGCKRGFHGGQQYVYDARHYLVLSVPLPFTTQTEASSAEPMLGLAIRISPMLTAELAMRITESATQRAGPAASMYASAMDIKLEDAVLRLLEALALPQEALLLGPSILREISYRVLTGEQGAGLRAAMQQGGHFGRIAKVLRRIHAHYAQGLDVATLADEASLSVPAFHSHFKAITATSPIQYMKSIRLHQARLMMIRNGLSAASASEQVGYESPSQFSREFKRLFGRSPLDEARQLKQVLSLAAPVAQSDNRQR